jgi:hypothetical protein
MLEALRAYGAGLLAGEQEPAHAALARYAVRVAEEAGAGMLTVTGELAAARWLDAEDAMMGSVLAWAVEHDLDAAARLVTALAEWWALRGRLAGQEPLLRELAGRAEPGSDGWCAAQRLLAWTAYDAAGLPQALQRCAVIIDVLGDREPSRALVDCLSMQSRILANLGRVPRASSWPGKVCRFRASPAQSFGSTATCWPGRWPRRGTWPPPSRPAPPRWPRPGTQATWFSSATC